MAIDLTCTLTQVDNLRQLLGTQAIGAYVRDSADAGVGTNQKVLIMALLDAKAGAMIVRFATAADQPTVAQVQATFANNVEIAGVA